MLKALIIPVTPFAQNCSIVFCEQTKKAAIVDPGGDTEKIETALKEYQLEPEKIWITHGHLDHAGAAARLSKSHSLIIEGPNHEDRFLLESLDQQGAQFNMEAGSFLPERWLDDGDVLTIGKEQFDVHHCPGHTPGHVAFHHKLAHLALVGDVLFAGSIGRTDLPRGDSAALIDSIVNKLWPLGDDVTFIPGHGELSTFGQERKTNPYVADRVLNLS